MDKIKMFEMMQKLNPDFIIEASTFDSTFDDPNVSNNSTPDSTSTQTQTQTPDSTSPSSSPSQADNINSLMQGRKSKLSTPVLGGIFDDGTISIGELKCAIYFLEHSKSADEAKKSSLQVGIDVAKVVTGVIGAGMFVAGTAGIGAAVIGVAGVVASADDVKNFCKKLFAPQKKGGQKQPNDLMRSLSIDNDVSVLLDDGIEYAFIDYAQNLILTLPDETAMPDFFEELKKFIKEKYSAIYNLIKT